MGKHGICVFSRRLLHQLFAIVSIHAEGKCRQGIRNQVYPQNMTRLQRRRKAGQNRCKHCDNFPEIRGQEKQDRFADILINPTSLADCLLNCGKIIIRQNQVCGIPRINSAKVASRKDLVNVKELAEYAKANNSKIVVTGYADSKTGSAEYNQKLSEKRAETVANELVKMGVNRDNIITEAKGGVMNLSPFSYNRRATVKIQ